jgi:FdhE protein
MSAPSDPFVTTLAKRLDDLARQTPELEPALAFYRAAIPLLRMAQRQVAPITLDPAYAGHKLQNGTPLLTGEALPLDEQATAVLWLRLCRLLEEGAKQASRSASRSLFSFFKRETVDAPALLQHIEDGDTAAVRGAAAEQLRRAVERGQLDLTAVWMALLSGDLGRIERLASELALDFPLLRTLGWQSLQPSLRAWAKQLKANLANSNLWQHATCPICGSVPLLSEIQGKEGARRLRCGVCGASWGYARLACACCGNRNYRQLGYLAVEGEDEKYRLQTCAACRSYLKVVVTYDPIPVDLLVVEDLATHHLDLVAAEHGFQRR